MVITLTTQSSFLISFDLLLSVDSRHLTKSNEVTRHILPMCAVAASDLRVSGCRNEYKNDRIYIRLITKRKFYYYSISHRLVN